MASRIGAVGGAVPGAVLGAVAGAAAKLRRTKPLHPAGRVGEGAVHVTSPQPGIGVPLLADRGVHPCVVRWSRAVGLPDPLPDVEGLAVRFEDPRADLLFASTGTGRVTRFLLAPRLPRAHGSQTTLLPVSSEEGALLFKVTPCDESDPPHVFDVAVARGGSRWRSVGTLEVDHWGPDRPMRFDPVANVLPGTEQYSWVRFMREPAYLLARRGSAARA